MVSKRTAIVFLTKKPNAETKKFAETIYAETDFEVFVVPDDESEFGKNNDSVRHYGSIEILDSTCIENGYVGCNINSTATHIKRPVIAYDKCLYYFCELNPFYDFVWVFEDDCFIPSIDTIVNLNEKYCQNDLVVPNHFFKKNSTLDWHWKHIVDKINPPYFYSMVCAAGFSQAMLNTIKEYVAINKRLFHIEAMFNTLAQQNNLKVADPLELKSVVWMGEWGLDEFLLLPNNVFHPIKDIDNYNQLRLSIAKAKIGNYTPKNKLPDFIKRLM
jgi:hypothetical protein